MDPTIATFHKIAECAGEIHACFADEKKMKALPIETQAFLYVNKACAEKFIEQMKQDTSGPPLESVLEAILIHCAALQGKCDELMEKPRWFARWRKS